MIREGTLLFGSVNMTSGYHISRGAALGTELGTLALERHQVLTGGGTVLGNLINAWGDITLKSRSEKLRVTGDYVQERHGVLFVEILSETVFGSLQIGGAARFRGGEIQVGVHSGFDLQAGQQFHIVTAEDDVTITEQVRLTDGWTFTRVGNVGRLIFTGNA